MKFARESNRDKGGNPEYRFQHLKKRVANYRIQQARLNIQEKINEQLALNIDLKKEIKRDAKKYNLSVRGNFSMFTLDNHAKTLEVQQ